MLKALSVSLLLWTAGAAQAASPAEDYLAARDRYVKDINREAAKGDGPALDEKMERARAELEGKLKALIGPVTVAGFPPEGRINLVTLLKEMGYGRLDGLAHTVPATDATLVVTTEALLKSWLKAHKDWWPKLRNVPQSVPEALRSEVFYTQAIGPDAAFAEFATLPVAAPAGSGALSVLLGLYRQDIGPAMPDTIVIGLVRKGRVFVVSQPAAVTVDPIPVCDRNRQSQRKKAEGDADNALRRCFAEHVKEQAYFPVLLRQAQALVNALSAP